MRSGGCALQQTLTSEAATVLKHSLGLARRRGHAQVTPLHVAATLLSLRASSFRRACLKSHPHHQSSPHSQFPLHCRALELCFNVALNRLPTTPTPNLLHTHQPSLSNALIAALKRAQAHQRRGCIEQQNQQPLLTIKVELEQLVISILDDPSVSRVMREAGFSSTAVKSSIEDSSVSPPCSVFQCYNTSGGVFSSPCSPSPSEHQREAINPNSFRHTHFYNAPEYYNTVLFCPQKRTPVYPITEPAASSSKEDIKLIFHVLLRKKKRNAVIVGDSVSTTEGLVGELMGRLDKGEVPDELKSACFIKFHVAPVSLRSMKRDEVEMNLLELKRKVDSAASGGDSGGAIIYIGDLKWTVEENFFSEKEEEEEASGYNPVDHVIAEIGKVFSEHGSSSNAKVWLMATASYQTYMRCQMRQPPLETQWSFQTVLVPSGGLGLSLHASSVLESKMNISQNSSHTLEKTLFNNKEEQDKLTCCEECASNYEKDAQMFKPGQTKFLPSWLQSHSIEAHQKEELTQLRRKWNRLCQFLHQSKHSQNHWNSSVYSNHSPNGKIYPYNSSHPMWSKQGSIFPDSNCISFADSAAKSTHSSNLVPRFRRQQSCTIELNFSSGTHKQQQAAAEEPSLKSLKGMEGKDVKITLALGNSQFGGSEQREENVTDTTTQRRDHVCKLLQENVPWQSETISSITEALVVDSQSKWQNPTWLILKGNDSVGKIRLARAIAESLFGSDDLLLQLDMKKETLASHASEVLRRALEAREELVVLIENINFADTDFKKFIGDIYETGKFSQAIFIVTTGGSTMIEEQSQDSVIQLTLQVSETNPNLETHCIMGQKRKAEFEFDLFAKIKNPRTEDKEVESNRKKDCSRQSSFNTLDLNMKADEENEDDEGDGGSSGSPISSDLTRETMPDSTNPKGFLESIKNKFELNRSPARDREMAELFSRRIKTCFEELHGKQKERNFSIEEKVIEEIVGGCGSFTNRVFEKWLKDIFQRSLETGKEKEEEGIGFRLCWGGNGKGKQGKGGEIRVLDSGEGNGFMSSCLPKSIKVNYLMD